MAKIGDMILFPKYAFKNILGPVILALFCFIASFFVFDMSATSITIYLIIGLIFWILFGVFSGINYILFRTKTDVRGLINFGFELTKKSLNDLKTDSDNVRNEGASEILCN